MAATSRPSQHLPVAQLQAAVGGGQEPRPFDVLRSLFSDEHLVERPEDLGCRRILGCGPPDRVAGERRHSCGLRPPPLDVADDDRPPTRSRREDIVKVPPDLPAPSSSVIPSGYLQPRNDGSPRREEAGLECSGHGRGPVSGCCGFTPRLCALDEATNMLARRRHRRHELPLRQLMLCGEQLDHAGKLAVSHDWEGNGASQALLQGGRNSGEVRIGVEILDPCGLPSGPNPTGQALATDQAK